MIVSSSVHHLLQDTSESLVLSVLSGDPLPLLLPPKLRRASPFCTQTVHNQHSCLACSTLGCTSPYGEPLIPYPQMRIRILLLKGRWIDAVCSNFARTITKHSRLSNSIPISESHAKSFLSVGGVSDADQPAPSRFTYINPAIVPGLGQ